MITKAFTLYYNRKEKVLKIAPAEKLPTDMKVTSNVTYLDHSHYVSTSKDSLKKKANEIKKEWIEDCKKDLKNLESIKIL